MLAVDCYVGMSVDYPSHTHNGFVVVWVSLLRHGGGTESAMWEIFFDFANFLFMHALEVEADSGAAGCHNVQDASKFAKGISGSMPRSSGLSQAEDFSQTFLNCEGIRFSYPVLFLQSKTR